MEVLNINGMFSQLKQDPKSDIQTLRIIEGETALVIAELKPMKKLGAHYHTSGAEIYHVLSGAARMEIGELAEDGIRWLQDFSLESGDVLAVDPYAVHRLSNTGDNPVRLIFFASPSHLSDEDRIFV